MSEIANADYNSLRSQMPVTRQWAYFNHAAVSPLPLPTVEAMTAWANDMMENGATNWSKWAVHVERARDLAASLLGAQRDEIALVANTTTGVNLIADAFRWTAGDNVVTFEGEFPTNLYPWMNLERRGVEVRTVPTDAGKFHLDDLASRCDKRTRIVAVSWVGYAAGWRIDVRQVADIAHAAGSLLFLDAIQGLGVYPLEVREAGVDFLAADGHKWLLGPEGAGVLYIGREHLDKLEPRGIGWNSVRHSGQYANTSLDLKRSAGLYEGGSYNVAGLVGLAASLELLTSYETATIERRLLEISDLACEKLRACGAQIASHREGPHRSAIVAFDLPGRDLKQVQLQLKRQHVATSFRAGRLRIGPHAYNNEEDIDRLVAAIKACEA